MVQLRVSPLVKLMVLTLRVTPSATRRALAKDQSHWCAALLSFGIKIKNFV